MTTQAQLDREERAMDFLYGYLDEAMRNDKFSSVDVFLDNLDPDQLTPVIVIAVLIATLPAAHLLRRRNEFIRRSRAILSTEPEPLSEVLSGLVPEGVQAVLSGAAP